MTWLFGKLCLFALLFWSVSGFSQSFGRDDDADRELPLPAENLQYLVDYGARLTFSEVQIKNFRAIPKRSMSFGFSTGAVWLRLQLANPTQDIQKRWLEFDAALLSDWAVYQTGQDLPIHRSGLSLPRADGDSHRSPVFAFELKPQSQNIWFIRLSSNYAINFNPHLHTTQSLDKKERWEAFFLGSYAGVMTFTYILTLYLFFRTRHRNFIYYSFVLLSFHIGFHFSNNHVASLYLWPQAAWWSERSAIMMVELANVFGIIFIRDTLQTKHYAPRIDAWIRFIPLRAVFFVSWAIFDFSPQMTKLSILYSVFLLLFYYGLGIYVWKRGYGPARYFSIAWLPVLIATLLSFAQDANIWVASSPSTQQAIRFEYPLLAAAIQAIILGIAVGDQFRRAQEEQKIEHIAREKLEQGMDDAHAVQEAFIRHDSANPNFEIRSSHQTSAKIGGDWLGYHHEARRKRLLLAISDVTGHGLPSALLSGALHGAFYGLAAAEPFQHLSGPKLLEKIMGRLNSVVRTTAQNTGLMATMAILSVDLESFRIDYINAGHTPILISGRSGQHFMLKGGSPLGISEDPQFGKDSWQAQAEDILFLFTDGLLEQTETGRRNHLKALAQDITPDLSIDTIHQHIESRMNRNPTDLEDDSSYILCRLFAA